MSRTYKDKPNKSSYLDGTEKIPCKKVYTHYLTGEEVYVDSCWYKDIPGYFPKKRKEVDTEDHWMSTPGWWVKMTMTKPERRGAHLLEKKVLTAVDLEEVDMPDLGRKPHIYFW